MSFLPRCLRPLLLIAFSLQAWFLSAEEPRQPNILWLSCEDLSPRLPCYGDETVPTPNIDRLAREGIRYTRAFTCVGVCAPCRYSIITGIYPTQGGAQYMRTMKRTGALDQIADPKMREEARTRKLFEAVPPEGVRCFPEYLRQAGYYCTNNSKEDYQFQTPVTAWDVSNKKAEYDRRAKGQPFFAVYNYMDTHESRIHRGRHSPAVTDRSKVRVPRFLPDTPVVREDIARYYDNIVGLDKWVGEHLKKLEEEGLSDSTIVFFFSDHGDGLPRHKRWVYDSGTHVPLLVRFPDGFGAGTVDESMMSFVDLPPTALALAGIEPPEYMQGRVFAGPHAEPSPKYVFMHRDRMDDISHETIRAVRDKRYQYVRNYRPQLPYLHPIAYRDRAATMGEIYRLMKAGKLGPDQWQWSANAKPIEELYDTESDPDEVDNLASDPRYLDKLSELRTALEKWVAETNDPLAMPEPEVVRTRVWPPSGEQPVTKKPEVQVKHMGSQSRRVTITCATPGASIGYRTRSRGPWTIYTKPFETTADSLEVVAHRIGWKPATVDLDLAQEE